MTTPPADTQSVPTATRNLLFMLFGLLFSGTVAVLLWQVHTANARREAMALEQFREDTANLAAGLDYFFLERHNDLNVLAGSRQIETYFENVALGMSPQYGLLASAQEITTFFTKTLAERNLGRHAIFEALVLVDSSGQTVAGAGAPLQDAAYVPDPALWPKERHTEPDGFQWAMINTAGSPMVVMAHPVAFRGRPSGQLLARLSFPVILQALFKSDAHGRQRTYCLAHDQTRLFCRDGQSRPFPPELSGLLPMTIKRLSVHDLPETGPEPALAVLHAVPDSSLAVLGLTPERALLGAPTWPITLLVSAVSALFLGGLGFVLHAQTQRLILNARIEEQNRSEQELRRANEQMEVHIRERTRELAETNSRLHGEIEQRVHANRDLQLVVNAISAILIGVDDNGRVFRWSQAASQAFGLQVDPEQRPTLASLPIPWDRETIGQGVAQCLQTGQTAKITNARFSKPDGTSGFLVITISPLCDEVRGQVGFLLLGEDITEIKFLEAQLAQASKLEGIGQLAAGIAHEINTPVQFVNDSVTFLRHIHSDLDKVLQIIEAGRGQDGPSAEEILRQAHEELDAMDLDFVRPEIPRTFASIDTGIQRISLIVQAMNRFSHSHGDEKKLMNLHSILENTLIISRNEWKYVADVVTDFDPDMVEVLGLPGEMGQVFLNIIINAAHAIGDVVRGTQNKGLISISTRLDDRLAEIRIQDTGPGIPDSLGDKIFNLFFTTKKLGKGTGQGLHIAYDIVVNKHGGTLTFTSQPGQGTTFIVRLPLADSGQNLRQSSMP